jgi:hypothetical protein
MSETRRVGKIRKGNKPRRSDYQPSQSKARVKRDTIPVPGAPIIHPSIGAGVLHVDSLELLEDDFHGLPDHIREHIQPAPVRHANHHFLNSKLSDPIHQHLEAGNHRLVAFDPKPLHRPEALRQNALEGLAEAQTLQNELLFGFGVWGGRLKSEKRGTGITNNSGEDNTVRNVESTKGTSFEKTYKIHQR